MPLELTRARLSDGELLESYCNRSDQQAFATLVDRYEPMVKKVCRQVIAGGSQADDAAQQVFIALSEKAHTLTGQVSIASWLYRVAWNISSKTRRAMIIRQKHERVRGQIVSSHEQIKLPEPDTKLILQEAICELPEMQREAIVLHYFCGFTTAETAARLRCPSGTVAARVSRGLDQLRKKLSDRDLVLTIVAIKVILLAMTSRSKAAAVAAAAAKGGGCRARAGGFFRLPRVRPIYAAPAVSLLPGFLARTAWSRAFFMPFANAPYAGDRKWMWRWPDFSPVHRSLGGLSKLSQAALCVLTGLVCAGAGTAAVTGYDVITTRLANAAPGDRGGNAATATRKVVPSPSEEDSNQGSSYAGYHYGAATVVPEPGSLVLIVGAGAALLGRRTSMLRRAY